MHHNVNSSMYIDLKTFLAILRNIPMYVAKDYDITQHRNKTFIDIFNRANFSVPPTQNGEHKVNFTQLSLTLCLNDKDMRPLAIQV